MAEQSVEIEDITEENDGEVENASNNNSREWLQKFIEHYESLPVLWNSRLQEYKNKVRRNKALVELLESYKKLNPQATKEDVKKKINSLRSNYRKEVKKILQSQRSGASTDEVYKPCSWVFYALTFLGESEVPVAMHKLQPHNEVQETIVEEDIELNDQDLSQQTSVGQTQPSRSSIEPNVAPPPKKKKPLGPIAKQNELLSLACQYLSSANDTSSDDEYLNIAKVWANKMKTLEPNQRMFAEKAINDILFEAQLRTLHKNSVKINELDNRMTLYASSHATDATTSSLSTSTTPLSDFLHLSTQPDESNSDIVIEVPPTGDCNNVRYIFSQFKDN